MLEFGSIAFAICLAGVLVCTWRPSPRRWRKLSRQPANAIRSQLLGGSCRTLARNFIVGRHMVDRSCITPLSGSILEHCRPVEHVGRAKSCMRCNWLRLTLVGVDLKWI